MKTASARSLLLCLVVLMWPAQALSENRLNSDSDYSVKIAVTINDKDYLVGKLEYSNARGVFPLELVVFGQVGGTINVQPYVFEILERTVVAPNVHQIKARCLNDKYSLGDMILGTIDFRDELKPQVTLAWENGHLYLRNLTDKGKELHKKHFPDVWLGQ